MITPEEGQLLYRSLKKALKNEPHHRIFVELGVRRAETSEDIYRFLSENTDDFSLICVDCDNKSLGAFKSEVGKIVKPRNPAAFLLMTTTEAAAQVALELDWVFLDACHCFECCSTDINLWGAKLRVGGVLVVHDTTPRRVKYDKLFQHNKTRKYGVVQAVERSRSLKMNFIKLWEVVSQNGIQVYEKVKNEASHD